MPREEEDDLLDSTRYLVQNTFEKGSGLVVAKETTIVPEKQKPNISAAQQEQMADKVRELTGGESFGSTAGIHNMLILGPNETFDQQKRRTGKGVSFFSDFS
jgi:hypothetical protein